MTQNIEIFVGDININILDDCNFANEYLATMVQIGFSYFIKVATRVTNKTSLCLDHIFVRLKTRFKNICLKSFVLEAYITDHCPVMLNVSLKKKQGYSLQVFNL